MSYGVKRCKFFKNGDINFPGLSMIISENIYRNYQSLLNELSTKLVLSTGPVNYLFDYDSGKIILSLDEVKTGKYFIASTSSYLKETQYIDNDIALNWKGSTSSGISGLSFQSSTTIKSSNTLTSPVSSSSLNNFNSNIQNDNGFNENTIVNTSFQNDYCIKPRIINVIRLNEKSKHANFLLNHRSATSLEYVLNELSLFPQLGKVDKLYTKDGKKVAELKDLFGASLTFFAAKYFEKFNITEPNSKPMRINNNKDVYTPKSCSPIVSSKMSIKGGSANTTPISYEKNRNNEKELRKNLFNLDCASPYQTPPASQKTLCSISSSQKPGKFLNDYRSFSLPELRYLRDQSAASKELSVRFASLQLKVENNKLIESIAQLRSALEVLEFKYCQEMHKNSRANNSINYNSQSIPTPKINKKNNIRSDDETYTYTDGSGYDEEDFDDSISSTKSNYNQLNSSSKKSCCKAM